MALPLEQVIKQLEDSGIIAAETLKDFVPPKTSPKDGDELVQALVKSEKLTNFQGQQVKGGRAKSLKLGEYTILEKIGAGGMGQVFKARHRRMERTVAIKMLPPAMTRDAAAAARFQREVVAAAKLRHPNIVAADDAGQVGAAHFLVMEYVDGKDLSALVKKNGPFPVNKAVNYTLQAARGLEFAHSKGVVHRDIKPANLLLGSDGVVKILDMGLARLDSSVGAESGPQADLTGTGTIMGTVDYMAPEQALDTKHADARADIYSLGISLYYLLAGRAAFEGDTVMKKLLAHREHPIPSLQDTQTTVSKQLDAVFKKMVAKRVEDRYQTMSEVVEALERLGFGGSSKVGMGDIASTIDLSSADKKKLSKATKKPLGSITEVVASEKTKHLVLKIVGGSFGTIVAPILVFYLIRHLEKEDKPAANAPAAIVQPVAVATNNAPAANVQPVAVATNTTTQLPAHVVDDGSPKPLNSGASELPGSLTFVSLFDGRSLKGWNGDKQFWSVQNGSIIGRMGPGDPATSRNYISTESTYRNFVLTARFKVSSGDVGILFRGKPNRQFGLQVLVGAVKPGMFFDETPTERKEKARKVVEDSALATILKQNQWNDIKITANGDQFECEANGRRAFSVTYSDGLRSGVVSLKVKQDTDVAFMDIKIARLPD